MDIGIYGTVYFIYPVMVHAFNLLPVLLKEPIGWLSPLVSVTFFLLQLVSTKQIITGSLHLGKPSVFTVTTIS